MTPAELREALAYFSDNEKLAAQFMARELDVATETIQKWLQGRGPISTPAEVAIKLLCELHAPLNPPMTREPLKPPMTREELIEATDELYDYPLVSQRQHHLAVDLGISSSTILAWRQKRQPVQGPARAAIQLMLKKKRLERRTGG